MISPRAYIQHTLKHFTIDSLNKIIMALFPASLIAIGLAVYYHRFIVLVILITVGMLSSFMFGLQYGLRAAKWLLAGKDEEITHIVVEEKN